MIRASLTPYVWGAVGVLVFALAGYAVYQDRRADSLAARLDLAETQRDLANSRIKHMVTAADVAREERERLKVAAQKYDQIMMEISDDPDANDMAGDAILRAVRRLGLHVDDANDDGAGANRPVAP